MSSGEWLSNEATRKGDTMDNKLSVAASAIWRYITAEPDPMGDPSGDLGSAIASWERDCRIRAVLSAGYTNVGEYNRDLAIRTSPKWASILEIEYVCLACEVALTVTDHDTFDGRVTVTECPSCGAVEVM